MGKVWDYISVKSNAALSTKRLVASTALVIGIFHIALLAFFWYFDLYQLVVLNAVSVLTYFICYILVKKGKNLLRIFNIMYIEIVVYSIVATLLIGIDCGFMLYLIAVVPLGYYIAYNFRDETDKVNPMIYVFVAVIAFWGTRVVHRFVPPLYSLNNIIIDRAVYMVNYTGIVVAIVAFCSTILGKVNNLEEKQKIQNDILEELSKLDPLTGLVNRRSIQERYEIAESKEEVYAVILGDIDDFKLVNDTYGHDIGDEVLKCVAEIFKSVIRGDDIVCRWGGEEILVFLPNSSKEQAIVVAERILGKIRELEVETKNKKKFGITMTLGVAVSSEGANFNEIVKKADERLYIGKGKGKNTVINE